MTDNVPVRAATAAELLKFRSSPSAIFAAQINQASFTYPISELTYDGATGTYTDIKPGYLCYVGSAAGLKDKGIARIWKSASSTKIYINPISDGRIDFAEDDHLTIWTNERQAADFGLAIWKPESVYTARTNQASANQDNLVYIEYHSGVGTLADVLPGMSLWIGSAAGLYDKGIVRIRKTPTDAQFFVGAASDLTFSLNDYLTVVDDFSLWGRETQQNGTSILMDTDIDYSARGGSAIVRAGPMVSVLHLVGGTVTFTPPSPALSACYDGATISSWAYSAPGSATSENMTAGDGTASWTYDTAGQYRWSLTVTDSNSKTTVTYRTVFVDPVSPDFTITDNPKGSFDNGGWSFGVSMYDNASKSDVIDRALVCLYVENEYYNGVEGKIGRLAGYENIVAVGWIDGETIVKDSQQNTVSFMVEGPAHWMKKIRASAVSLENTATTPAGWSQIENMTADKALAHILHWTSTAPMIMDCFFTGDTTALDILTQPSGSLYTQLEAAAINTIFANPLCNSLGQLFIEIDPQIMNSTARAALTTVMTITTADYEGSLELNRLTSGDAAMIELQCNSFDGINVLPVYSRAPGNIGKVYGNIEAPGNYYAADQDECNRLAGCLLALRNQPYDSIDLTLAMQNRLIDIAPAQYCQISIAAGDTIRGVALTNQKIIPRSVTLQIGKGYYKTDVSFELATSPIDGITYYPPQVADETEPDNYDSDSGGGVGSFPSPKIDFPSFIPSLPFTVPDCKTSTDLTNAPTNLTALVFDKLTLKGSDTDRIAYAYCPCYIRKSTALAKTDIWLIGNFINSKDAVHLYGVKNGSRVATATMNLGTMGGQCTFAPAAAVLVDGFELEIDAGSGFLLGDVIESGTVNGNNESGISIGTLTIDQYYALESSGGPVAVVSDWRLSYQYQMDLSGRIGYNNFSWDGSSYATQLPTGAEFLEVVGTYYGRIYFKASAASVNYRVYDSPPGEWYNNTGTLGYTLYNATASDLLAIVGSSTLRNVCSV